MDLSRLEILIGKDNINKIKTTSVLLVGLGGVGGYTVEALVRSGIENITIVDYDKIDKSNLNRQLISLNSNIGKYKTDEIRKRIKDINSSVKINVINEFINEENINLLFENKIDYIIDACDTLDTKKELIKTSIEKNIKLISCMGTGKRMDPTKLKICNLDKTSGDPIARTLRKYVKDNFNNKKIKVICSDELPIKTETNVIGSNSFVSSSAGLLCASYIINDIVNA